MAVLLGDFLDKILENRGNIRGLWLEVAGMRHKYQVIEIDDSNPDNPKLIAEALMTNGRMRQSQAKFDFRDRSHLRNVRVLGIRPSGILYGVRVNTIVRCR